MMRALLTVEFFKLFKQRKTYYALAAVLAIEAFILVSAYFQGSVIIDVLLENLKESFYFKGELLNGNLLVYLILNSLWFHLPLILMIVIAELLTSEYKDRTLQTVMLQPVSKWKFILSKYIVAIIFTIVVVFLLASSAFIASYAVFGSGDLIVYNNVLSFFDSRDAMCRLIWAFISGTFSMVFFSVVSLTLAIVFKEAGKTWIFAALFLILTNLLLRVDLGDGFLSQLFYAKLNNSWQLLFDFKIKWNEICFSNGLLLLYTAIIMGFGIYLFHKKDVG